MAGAGGYPRDRQFLGIAQKVRASYEVPKVRSKAQKVNNEHSSPPAPKCVCWMAFLPPEDPKFPCQDYGEGQLQKTLAYAWALQYWAEKANPPMPGQQHLLARCVQELRWEMSHYVTFMDDAVLEEMIPWQELPERWTKESSLVETLPTPTLRHWWISRWGSQEYLPFHWRMRRGKKWLWPTNC